MTLWRWIVSWLAALSADPTVVDTEPPRAAAAVAVAYAALRPGDAPAPAPPTPPAPVKPCGGKCQSGVYRPDGSIPERCPSTCTCGCQRKASAPKCSRCLDTGKVEGKGGSVVCCPVCRACGGG